MSMKTFKYFAFGSNLLKERIHLNSPSAMFVCVAKLQDYKIKFAVNHAIEERQSKTKGRWGVGGGATIAESPGDSVWGTLWEIGEEHLPALDRQEGVELNIYRPLTVTVTSQGNDQFECRTYQMVGVTKNLEPSPHYLGVVLEGASQSGLPEDYMQFLKSIKHNNYQGDSEILNEIRKNALKKSE